ncbi:pyrroline-5-carboxylate reductase [Fulvivirgaceae bacterium BMA10]|uniref:Pyrroline-5-carboxylate reductase n=1 Tax=Splendidivirga corallicola TaxID=3051826 RepID=A0ABT8KVC4_9BACT|nr:pyrroline-5-carboxylate reductase [Fulvivirgaceae bacterium BMA10]
MNKKIAVIGGGNLGISITQGLIADGFVKPEKITVTRRRLHLLKELREKGVAVDKNNVNAVKNSDIIIMVIKPYQMKDVLEEIKPVIDPKRQIVISAVTGFSIDEMKEIVGEDIPVFRVMPNTAIAIRESMTCIATTNGTQDQIDTVTTIFDALGKSVVISEELMEAATVLGACGIAYSLRFIRAATQGGIEIGFDAKTAELIASQTVKGAANLLLVGGNHPEREIDKVTTPQGCTIVGLNEMEHRGFSSSLIKGIRASFNKIAKMIH